MPEDFRKKSIGAQMVLFLFYSHTHKTLFSMVRILENLNTFNNVFVYLYVYTYMSI